MAGVRHPGCAAQYARLVPVRRPGEDGGERDYLDLAGLFTRPAVLIRAAERGSWGDIRMLNEACDLLRLTPMPVEAVSRATGYPDVASFAGAFHRATGWDPVEWRRRYGRRPRPP